MPGKILLVLWILAWSYGIALIGWTMFWIVWPVDQFTAGAAALIIFGCWLVLLGDDLKKFQKE